MDFTKVTHWKIPEGNCIRVCRVLPDGEREVLWELGVSLDFVGIETTDSYVEVENIIKDWVPGYTIEHADGTKEFGYGYGCWDQASALFWVVSTKDDWWNIAKGDALILYVNKELIASTGEKIIIIIERRVSAAIYYNDTSTVQANWNYNPIRIEIFMENGIGKIRTYDKDGDGATGSNVDFSFPIVIHAR